jgi:Flp pilus assembly protein TadG
MTLWSVYGSRIERMSQSIRNCVRDEIGGAMVEMAISSTILFTMIFGMFQVSYASYVYSYVSEVAREGSRYAIVRGSTSCGNTPNLTGCNASPTTIGNYVLGRGFMAINPANMTVTTTWLTATTTTGTSGTSTTWTACSSGTCNAPGNMVNVVVTYGFPLSIPFLFNRTLNITSTSEMVVPQ